MPTNMAVEYKFGDQWATIRMSEQQFLNLRDEYIASMTVKEKFDFFKCDDLFKKTLVLVPIISELDEKIDMFAHGFVAALDCADHLRKHKEDYTHCDIAAGIIESLNRYLDGKKEEDKNE